MIAPDGTDWEGELRARQAPPVARRPAGWQALYKDGLAESVRILGTESAAFAEGYADSAPSAERLARAMKRKGRQMSYGRSVAHARACREIADIVEQMGDIPDDLAAAQTEDTRLYLVEESAKALAKWVRARRKEFRKKHPSLA